MKNFFAFTLFPGLFLLATAFSGKIPDSSDALKNTVSLQARTDSFRLIHVFVALCDNDSQGIVPVPKKIGNGNDPGNNLYWGCGYGVRTFFNNSDDWRLISTVKSPTKEIMERCTWKHRRYNCYLVADAWKGARIKSCTVEFLKGASGNGDTVSAAPAAEHPRYRLADADLVAYVGHDGLMDFELADPPKNKGGAKKDVMILACSSRMYFKQAIRTAGANPVLWTTNLMAPEAYTLKAAIDGWLLNEKGEQIRERASLAYNQYQKCGINGARNLFATGF